MGKFISTEEIYGIPASKLENVPYKEALIMKSEGIKPQIRKAAEEVMSLYKDPSSKYEDISEGQSWLSYLLKADEHTNNLLNELSNKVEF